MQKSLFYTFAATVFLLAYHDASAVTMGTTNPTFARLLYKGHPSLPTTPNTSIVNSAISAGATYTLGAVSGFKGAFTPVNVGITVGSSLIAYGIMTALSELRIQAGANVPQYTAPDSFSNVQPNDNYTATFTAGTPGQPCVTTQTYTGTTSYVCNSINSQRSTWYSCSNTSNFVPVGPGAIGNCIVTSSGAAYLTLTSVGGTTACPAGYTLNGSSCEALNISSVPYPSDGKPSWNIKYGGDGQPYFSPDSRDPDVATDPPQLEQVGHDQYGNPVAERVTPNKNGGITIRRETQSEHPTTHLPMTQADTISTDSFGTVTQVTSTVYDNSQVTNISNNLDTSGLAQQATLAQINDKLGEATAPDLTNIDQPVIDARAAFISGISGAQTTLDTNPAASVSPVAYWTYASGTCYPLEWDAGRFGKLSLSSFCSIYDTYIKPLEIWVLGVFGMLHAWQIWRTTVSVI